MSAKRFHPRLFWHRTALALLVGILLISIGMVWTGITGSGRYIMLLSGLVIVGLSMAMFMDRRVMIDYIVQGDTMLLRHGNVREVLPLASLKDANLMDGRSVANYAEQYVTKMARTGGGDSGITRRAFMRFCSANRGLNGMNRWLSAQFGSNMDRANDVFVLLRVRDGRELLLSPKHSEDLVSAINRKMQPQDAQLDLFNWMNDR